MVDVSQPVHTSSSEGCNATGALLEQPGRDYGFKIGSLSLAVEQLAPVRKSTENIPRPASPATRDALHPPAQPVWHHAQAVQLRIIVLLNCSAPDADIANSQHKLTIQSAARPMARK